TLCLHAGCDPFDVGSVSGDTTKSADAMIGAGDDDGGIDGGSNVDPNCIPAAAPNGNGNHNAGADCISANCHLPGQNGPGAPEFQLAGTLYTDKAGAAVVAGGTVVVTDANGTDIPLITASNGNFYTAQLITFPVAVKVSKCPTSMSMPDPVQQ